MAGDWETVPLGELYDFSSGLSKPKAEFGFGHGFLSFKDVFYNYFAPATLEQLVNATEKEQQSCSIKRGDVFLTRTSETMEELGMSCVALQNYERATFNGFTKRLRPKASTQIVPEYAGYYFRSPSFRREVTAMSSLSTRASLNNEMLGRLKMVLPPVTTQEAIGSILKALDDKIELNRRMNATLEAMARALFESWFVDFDPVRAKLDGRRPLGLDEATAALFPERFEETALGPIPKGWNVKRIEEIAERVAMGPFGSSIKVSTFVQHGIPVISGQHLHEMMLDDSEFNFVTHEHADQLHRSNVQRGDVILTHAGSIGQVALIPESSQFTRYVISQRQFYLRCDRAQMSPLYVVLYFKTADGQHRLLANTSSTGVPSIAQPVTYLRQLRLVVPPPPLLTCFDEMAGGWMKQVAANLHQSRTLATLRDTLLPKLLSGELSLPATSEAFKGA